MERYDTCANTFSQTLEPCMCVTRMKMCEICTECVHQKNVRATSECMYTHRRTRCSCYYMLTKPNNNVWKTLPREKWTLITPWPSWLKKSPIRRLGTVIHVQNLFQNSQTSSFHVRFILSCWYLSHQLPFLQSLWVEASRFPEACVSDRPTFLISWFPMMLFYGSFPIVRTQRAVNLLDDYHDM